MHQRHIPVRSSSSPTLLNMFLPAVSNSPPLRLSLHTTLLFFALVSVLLLLSSHMFRPYPPFPPPPIQLAPIPPVPDPAESYVRTRLLTDMPKCASDGGVAKNFLMVFMGHSGSTALMTSLAQHSATHIHSLEPVDHGKFIEGFKYDSALRALRYTMEYFENGTQMGKMVGFKIRPRHLQNRPANFSKLIRLYGTRIIWSYRTNMLKQAIGDYAIHYKGDKAAYEGLKVGPNGNVTANSSRADRFKIHDMNALHTLLKSRVTGDMQVARALHQISPDGCVLPISYESYLRRPELTLERVQTFLGLDAAEMHPALRRKATADSLCDVVENWSELCEAFFGCVQWRWMLDDFENGCSCSSLNPSRFKASFKYCAIS